MSSESARIEELERRLAECEAAGLNAIADGSCLLVVLGYRER